MIYTEYNQKYPDKGIIKLVLSSNFCTLPKLPFEQLTALDDGFTFENGAKTFSDAVETLLATEDLTRVATAIAIKYNQEWLGLYNQLQAIQQGTKTYTHTTSTNGTSKNQVSGYESDSMVDNDQNVNTGTGNESYTETDANNLAPALDLLKNNVLYDTIFSDVRNYIFTAVY